jgi:hypothetical protein
MAGFVMGARLRLLYVCFLLFVFAGLITLGACFSMARAPSVPVSRIDLGKIDPGATVTYLIRLDATAGQGSRWITSCDCIKIAHGNSQTEYCVVADFRDDPNYEGDLEVVAQRLDLSGQITIDLRLSLSVRR